MRAVLVTHSQRFLHTSSQLVRLCQEPWLSSRKSYLKLSLSESSEDYYPESAGLLPKTPIRNQFIAVIIDSCTTLARAYPVVKNHLFLTSALLAQRVLIYGILAFFLACTGLPCVNKFFKSLGRVICVKYSTTSYDHCKSPPI